MDWHKTYILPERLYALNQEKWETYVHVKFKLCIFRNRFLNISNKDHVGIHYHIPHWSMCYIFITRKACKTNHTLWIMPCFSRQICKVLSQTFPSAGGRRKQRLLQHSPLGCSASSAGGSHFKVRGVRWHLAGNRHKLLYYFSYFRPIAQLRRGSVGSSLFPGPWMLLPWQSDGISAGLVSLRKAPQLQSHHLPLPQIEDSTLQELNKLLFSSPPNQKLECLRHWNGLLTADRILSSNL